MSKHSVLIVGGDVEERQTIGVTLRKAGLVVTTAEDGSDALDKIFLATPALLIADEKLSGFDGFALCDQVRRNPNLPRIPFMLIVRSASVDSKIRALESGVDEIIERPIIVSEVVARVNLLLQKQQRVLLEERPTAEAFSGLLEEMPLGDLLQTLSLGKRTATISFCATDGSVSPRIFFNDGEIVDAECGRRKGEAALLRIMQWDSGLFEVQFDDGPHRDIIGRPYEALLRRVTRAGDDWRRLAEQLPPFDALPIIDYRELHERLADIPDEHNSVLRLCDGSRSITAILDAAVDYDDLETLQILVHLFFNGIIYEKVAQDDPIATVASAWPAAVPEPPIKPKTIQSFSEELLPMESQAATQSETPFVSEGGWLDLDNADSDTLAQEYLGEGQACSSDDRKPRDPDRTIALKELDTWLGD